MIPNKPRRTESTFTDNDEVNRLSGKSDFKRDGLIKDISLDFYDIDYAVKWHIENIIQPTIVEENSIISVPIIFASGEKWAAVQKHGYLRDNQGKVLTPLIMIRRNSVSKREDIQDIKVLETADARIIFQRKYTNQNRYNRKITSDRIPEIEYYSVDVPKFVQIEYELLCWTNNVEQLNEITEQMMWFDGKAFGDTNKYNTFIDPPSFETINSIGEDRVVKATMSMRTKGRILNVHGVNAPGMYKLNPVNRIVISQEVDSISDIFSTNTATPSISNKGPGIVTNTNDGISASAALLYLNMNNQLTGTVVTNTLVTFNSGWLPAPGGLPSTSIDNFIFFVNGVLLEKSAIISFTELLGVSTLVINSTNLGYTLVSTDEVIGVGKFSSSDSLA